ncbi:IclR family transcriptional regulator [Variovorax sp. KK3]|uniref:IclR family transcriptional regulator n=1 Tax=Variovorax sp. KK3 TaxID=1855728 RepID=UPI00097BDB31|nr:IclR family transcriptional regulator [Variovorax sp. KK3]
MKSKTLPARTGSASRASKDATDAKDAKDSTESKDPTFVTALARGLDVLRCFTAERLDLGTSEIARLTGLPQPTVWRLCKTLSQLGYLVPGHTPDRLRVGAGVLMLGHAAITHTGIAHVALPLMRQVADEFGISVSLAERYGMGMVVLQRIEAPSILRLNMHVGSALEIGDSSLGWAWLAAQSPEARAPVLKEMRKHYGTGWPQVSRNVEQALEEYAKHGFVCNFAKSHRDVNAIGVPVIAPDRRRVMSLTCGGAKSSLTTEKLKTQVAPAMRVLAERIAPMLGQGGDIG